MSKGEYELEQSYQRVIKKFDENLLLTNQSNEAFDFGTIAVYSCTQSCGASNHSGVYGAYHKEFAWRQTPL